MRLILLFISAIALVGCQSTGTNGSCLSPSFKPTQNVLYRYGNFCGPGWPMSESNPDNYSKLQAIKPYDDIDLVCKMHDLCYARFSKDHFICDSIFQATFISFRKVEVPPRGSVPKQTRTASLMHSGACLNQYHEINSGVVYVKQNSDGFHPAGKVTLASLVAIESPLTCANARVSGFPVQACHLKKERHEDKFKANLERIVFDYLAIENCGGTEEAIGNFTEKPCVKKEKEKLKDVVTAEYLYDFLNGEGASIRNNSTDLYDFRH